jgi:hypothetical protein
MYLKEFELDLPYVFDERKINLIMEKENCEFYDATKIDYELNWNEKRQLFRLETRCVTAMFERLFGKMKNDEGWKILVECVEIVSDERILNFSGVLTVQVEFNYEEFLNKTETEKKIASLDLLMRGIERVAIDKHWEIEQFRDVSLQIKNANYENEWIWKKAVKNIDNNYFSKVICKHNVKSMDISIAIMNKNGIVLQREKVISELPDEFAYATHLGELRWLSDTEVGLINKTGDNMVTSKIVNKI